MEIVLSTHWKSGLHFAPEHIAWFKAKGYSDDDIEAFNDNRNHPDLIECVKEIRKQGQAWTAEAKRLNSVYCKAFQKTDDAKRAFNDEMSLMRDIINRIRFNTEESVMKIEARIMAGLKQALSYEKFCQNNFEIKRICSHHDFASVYRELFIRYAILDTAEKEEKHKKTDLDDFCSRHHLNTYNYDFCDHMAIEFYNETLLEATIEEKCAKCTQYESLKLTPYVRVSDIEQYVATGDTQSIIEHLRKLGVIKIV